MNDRLQERLYAELMGTEALERQLAVASRWVLPSGAPAGLQVLDWPGVGPILTPTHDHARADSLRIYGWYYGYPVCCVEAFVNGSDRLWAEGLPYARGRAQHPISGHLLCDSCTAGPIAPLPPRPAERFGFGIWDDDGPDVRLPSGYTTESVVLCGRVRRPTLGSS